MSRYEILIGKKPPPLPPPPPPKVREIVAGERRAGKSRDLVNCIERSLNKGYSVIVCVFHPNKYMVDMLGPFRNHVQLIDSKQYRRGHRFYGAQIDAFYYDDIDLHQDMPEVSNARHFYEAKEIVVSTDLVPRGLCEYLNVMPDWRDVPKKIKVGMTEWDIVPVPRRLSSEEIVWNPTPDFKQEYFGKFI